MHKTRVVSLTALVAVCATLVCGSPTMAQTAPATTPTDASTTVEQGTNNPFRDVPANHWAYQAVQQLAADGLIQGYPNGTFRGNRPMTRYEMAVIINRAVNAVESKMAAGGTVSPADLAALRRLVDEFGNELKNVQGQVAALNRRVDNLERETAANTAQLNRAHPALTFWTRPGTFSQTVDAVNGPNARGSTAPGQALPAGTALTVNPGHGGTAQQALLTGTRAAGTVWQDARFVLTGALDRRWSYQFRIEDEMFGNTAPVAGNGLSQSTPGFCTSVPTAPVTCAQQDYVGALPLRLNYADVVYTAPSGLFTKIGRFVTDSGKYNENGLTFSGGQSNGIQLGFVNDRWNAWVAGVYVNSAQTNINFFNGTNIAATGPVAGNYGTTASVCAYGMPNCVTEGTNGILAKADYWFPSLQLDIGGSFNGYRGVVNTEWDPYAGLCQPAPGAPAGTVGVVTVNTAVACPANTARQVVTTPGPNFGAPITGAYITTQAPMSGGSIFAVKLLGPKARPTFKVSAEGLMRFGNDPLTGQNWVGNQSFHAELAYASKGNLLNGPLLPSTGLRNSNVVQMEYYNMGFNGSSFETASPYGTAPYQAFYYGNIQGWQNELIVLNHWFNDNFRAGFGVEHWNLRNNTTIPAGSLACPGCYLRGVNSNALFLDSYLIF